MRPTAGVYSSPSYPVVNPRLIKHPAISRGVFFYPIGVAAINVVKSSIFDKMKTICFHPQLNHFQFG